MQELIALNKLQLSESNVRKTHDKVADEQLSCDIQARGLLQNLIVTKAKKRGHYDVIAGGRRLRAMNMIVERGAWEPTHEVDCKVLVADQAGITETSLAENFQRVQMTPAEEVRAFQHFISQDGDTAAVAQRFGLTRRFVEGRLRLAALAEPIFEALASGDISLEVAKAYASTDQHEQQVRVFEQMRLGYNGSNPDTIRRMIADGAVRGSDGLALLVGEEAYLAAGGRINRDLFTQTCEDRWIDTDILHSLVDAKLQGEAARLLEETGIGHIWPVAGNSIWTVKTDLGLNAVRLPPAPLSDEARTRVDIIQDRLEAICSETEELDEESTESVELDAEYDRLSEELQELSNAKMDLPEEWRCEVGRFLIVSIEGKMTLDGDYYSQKNLRMERDEEGNITGGSFELTRGSSGGADKPSLPEATGPGGKAYSARLFDELALQRRNVLAAALLNDPGLALDYAIFALADSLAHVGIGDAGTTLRAPHPQDAILSSNLPVCPADEILTGAFEALDRSWSEGKSVVDRFNAFRNLDDDAKAAWIAFCMAKSLEAKTGYRSGYNPIHAQLGIFLDVEPAAMWRPTAENYFDRVPKGTILALLQEIGGSELSNRYASAKKSELSETCEKLFAGDVIIEDDVKQRALAWVPEAMRFDLAADTGANDDLEDSDGDPGNEDLDEDLVGNLREGGEDAEMDPDINDSLEQDTESDEGVDVPA